MKFIFTILLYIKTNAMILKILLILRKYNYNLPLYIDLYLFSKKMKIAY